MVKNNFNYGKIYFEYKKEKNIGLKPCINQICYGPLAKIGGDMKYKLIDKEAGKCLECGETMGYGRSDRKFCSDSCRKKHHNQKHRNSRIAKQRVSRAIDKNYNVLEQLLDANITSICLSEAIEMGFIPGFVTSYFKARTHINLSCYDIKFSISNSRIFGISRIQNISLSL